MTVPFDSVTFWQFISPTRRAWWGCTGTQQTYSGAERALEEHRGLVADAHDVRELVAHLSGYLDATARKAVCG